MQEERNEFILLGGPNSSYLVAKFPLILLGRIYFKLLLEKAEFVLTNSRGWSCNYWRSIPQGGRAAFILLPAAFILLPEGLVYIFIGRPSYILLQIMVSEPFIHLGDQIWFLRARFLSICGDQVASLKEAKLLDHSETSS